ncbi:hypothetical protein N7475_009019 [Penicillium sp. IBT 31633x]|nr:hypothetical protein N7475_009019 [Penicillium sp. IBT 31633x]
MPEPLLWRIDSLVNKAHVPSSSMGGIASIAIVTLNQPMNKTAMNRAIVMLHSPPKWAESNISVILMFQDDINQDWQRWEDDTTL